METLKLNCDASFFSEIHSGSWGVLIRDADGDVVISGGGKVDHLLSPFHAELIACLQGIQLAVNLGIGQIIVETDAQEVVKAINSSSYDDSVVGHLIVEVKSLLGSNFLGYELAALGYLCNESEELVTNSLPKSVSVIVANDLLANE
jgi:hypothetical protein